MNVSLSLTSLFVSKLEHR